MKNFIIKVIGLGILIAATLPGCKQVKQTADTSSIMESFHYKDNLTQDPEGCIFNKFDPYESHGKIPENKGFYMNGRCVDTRYKRPIAAIHEQDIQKFGISQENIAAKKQDFHFIANVKHMGKFYIAMIPKDGIDKVYFSDVRWFKIIPAGHGQIYLKFKPQKPVVLIPQDEENKLLNIAIEKPLNDENINENNFEEKYKNNEIVIKNLAYEIPDNNQFSNVSGVTSQESSYPKPNTTFKSTDGLFLSYEVAASIGLNYKISIGLNSQYIGIWLIDTKEDGIYERHVIGEYPMSQWELELNDNEKRLLLELWINKSISNGYDHIYNTIQSNCIGEAVQGLIDAKNINAKNIGSEEAEIPYCRRTSYALSSNVKSSLKNMKMFKQDAPNAEVEYASLVQKLKEEHEKIMKK